MKHLVFFFLSILLFACQSTQETDTGYDGGTSERGALSEYANKPLEDAREVNKASEERNKEMQKQLDF